MKWTEKFQSLLVIAAIFMGLGLGQISWLSENAVYVDELRLRTWGHGF